MTTDNTKVISSLDTLSILAEAVVGYYNTLINGGISAHIADDMVRAYHSMLMDQVRKATPDMSIGT